MLFEYKYQGFSKVSHSPKEMAMSFVPDASREPTWFSGKLRQHLIFREAISALHSVVVSDLRFKPKDREEYKRWATDQEAIWLAEFMQQAEAGLGRIEELSTELNLVRKEKARQMGPFYTARQKYYNYLYKKNYAWWFILDPVITIHPDEIFFECFSSDESSYAKLSCNHDVFEPDGEFACGTTNIDYSADLYREFQKIRKYRETKLTIDPSGFEVVTEEDAHREAKIDLPDSWVRGFLQVSSASTLPGYEIDLHPMDLHNICFLLKRKKEKKGPRSLRFILKPGQEIKIIVDPWGTEIKCPRSHYLGSEETEIRIWGRRQLFVLERLIPWIRSLKLTLLGYGMPSFWVADLGDLNFTLGLSGWTANDWSQAGNFDLLAPRHVVSPEVTEMVVQALRQTWKEASTSLADRLALPHEDVLGALGAATQAGLVIYDLKNQVWRSRELSNNPLPLDQLRFSNDRERAARELAAQSQIRASITPRIDRTTIEGKITSKSNKTYQVRLVLNNDERLIEGECQCNFFQQNKLRQGPCEHILALRIAASNQKKASH